MVCLLKYNLMPENNVVNGPVHRRNKTLHAPLPLGAWLFWCTRSPMYPLIFIRRFICRNPHYRRTYTGPSKNRILSALLDGTGRLCRHSPFHGPWENGYVQNFVRSTLSRQGTRGLSPFSGKQGFSRGCSL